MASPSRCPFQLEFAWIANVANLRIDLHAAHSSTTSEFTSEAIMGNTTTGGHSLLSSDRITHILHQVWVALCRF